MPLELPTIPSPCAALVAGPDAPFHPGLIAIQARVRSSDVYAEPERWMPSGWDRRFRTSLPCFFPPRATRQDSDLVSARLLEPGTIVRTPRPIRLESWWATAHQPCRCRLRRVRNIISSRPLNCGRRTVGALDNAAAPRSVRASGARLPDQTGVSRCSQVCCIVAAWTKRCSPKSRLLALS